MKTVFVLFYFFMVLPFVHSQTAGTIIQEADRLEAIPNEKAAFNKFKEVLLVDPDNLYALTKCSELCSRIGNREKNTGSRDSYYASALSYARAALKTHPRSDEANVVMAIALGRIVLVKSGKEKISAVKDIKAYADNALKINPRNFKAWHVLGKWNYEVSDLNMIERAATRVFYGGLPDASIKESINAYEKARALSPGFMLNYLELAKAYVRNNEKAKAIAFLRTVATLPNKTEDDPRIKAEAAKLLKDLL